MCGKIFEKLIFNALYSSVEDHRWLNPCQSGFKKNDTCINHLVSITHGIYSAFDYNPSLEVRGAFSDLSKALWIYLSALFSPKKISALKKIPYYFRKLNLLALTSKKLLYFLKRKLLLYFRKWNPELFKPNL